MSVDGISNTFYPITLSGLTLTDSLNTAYVPYTSANTTVNLNNQDLSNVKTLTAKTLTVGASYPLYAYNVFSYSPTVASIILNGDNQNPFLDGDIFKITGSSIASVNTTYTVLVNYPSGGFFTVLNNAGLSGNNYPTGGIAYLNGTGNVSSITSSTGTLTATTSTISGTETADTLKVLTLLNVGTSTPVGNIYMAGATSSVAAYLQYGVGGTVSAISDRLIIKKGDGTTVMSFSGTGTISIPSLVSGFMYMDATGLATIQQAIFSVGQTAACSPNLLLAGGGAFQISSTTNSEQYFVVSKDGYYQSTAALGSYDWYVGSVLKFNINSTRALFSTPVYGTGVVATGNPTLAAGTTAMWMLVESSATGVLGAGLYGTNYYPISYRGKTHQWQCDGVEKMNLSSTAFNVLGTVANIYTGTRSGAISNMALGSLTLGSTNNSYGGGSSWNSNTAGLLFETNNNTEIQVHHSGSNITSLMYYNGGNQQIYIGRDSGWGAKPLNIQGSLVCNSGSAFNGDVGVNANLYARSVIISGNGLYTAGCIYSDSNWGMLFRAAVNGAINSYNFRNSDGTEVMSITQSGNVGLGVQQASAKLDVRGPMVVRAGDYSTCWYGPNSSYNSYLLVGAGNGSSQVDGQTACVKTTNGNLHLDCAVGYSMYLNYYTNGSAYATTYYFGGFAYGSDERYKENIITADNELCYENIKKIRIVRYNFIKDSIFDRCTGNDKNRLGVLAQDLEKIYPNSVTETKDPETDTPFKAVDTRQMYYTLVGCTQELQKKVEEQQKQIDELTKLVQSLLNK